MGKVMEFILDRLPALRSRFDEHMVEVINGAAVALVLKVFGAGLTFLFNLVLARTLGAEGAGLYFLALTVTTIATVFGRMGLDNTLLRFTAANAAVKDWKAVKGVYKSGMGLALIASFFSATVMFLLAPLLAEKVFQKSELVSPMRWMALAVVPMSILVLYAQLFKGLKRIRDSSLLSGLGVPAISLIGLFLLGDTYGVKGGVWAYTTAALLTMLMGGILWKVTVPQLQNISGHFKIRELLKSSMPLFWVASLNMLIQWAATFALGIWGTEEDVGIFSVASRTAMLTSLVLLSVNSISAPKFAALYKKNEIKVLESTARKTTLLMVLIASPLLVFFLLFPGLVMGVFGAEFVNGRKLLSILAIGQFINVATGSAGSLLIMSGNERIMKYNSTLVASISIILNVLMVSFMGVIGAAIATSICLSIKNIFAAYFVWVKLRIWTFPSFFWKVSQ